MDLIVVMIIVTVIGCTKLNREVNTSSDLPMYDTPTYSTTIDDTIPVGNNLTMIREPNAFTRILKEFELI